MRMLVKSIAEYNFKTYHPRRRKNLPRRFLAKRSSGMEMVQVAILVAIAVAAGIIFKSSVVDFVNRIFRNLNAANF